MATAEVKAEKPQPQGSAAPVTVLPLTEETNTKAGEMISQQQPEHEEEPVAEELQNELTAKFTEAEWKSLKELRTSLPTTFQEAFPEKPDAKSTPIKLWGITLDPNHITDARASVVLMKFLRARNLNVSSAQEVLISTLRWRDSFNVDAVLQEEFPEDIFGKLGHVYGKDRESRPVTYNLYGANSDLKAVFGDVPRFIRWRVQLMEKGVAQCDFEKVDQMIQIHDYEGVSLSSRDANSKNAAAEATNIFQSHYPEFLYKKYFVNVPTLLTWLFAVFKPLVSSQTLAKMTVVGYGSHKIGRELISVIEPSQLPRRYGGSAEAF